MNKARKNYIKSCEVSELAVLNLGGYKQKVLIEGKSKNLPAVICLHGGPGSPVPFSVGCRGLFPEWTDKAIMVYWDQLGCGANNHKIDDSFKIENFVDMTADLVAEIKKKFPENRLYIFGISWGSILALKTALRLPELDGVVVSGQIVKELLFNGEVFSALENAPAKAKRKLNKIRADGTDCPYKTLDKNMKTLVGLINKYTNGQINCTEKSKSFGKIVKGLLTSPDYSFSDFRAIVKNGYRGNKSLWRELLKLDLTKDLSAVKVPYKIVQGETDLMTPTEKVIKAVEGAGNADLSVSVVKNSGHFPSDRAMEEIFKTVCEMIR